MMAMNETVVLLLRIRLDELVPCRESDFVDAMRDAILRRAAARTPPEG